MPTVPYRILLLDITPAATSSTVQTPTYSVLTASSAVTSKNISDSLSTKASADYSTPSGQIEANDCSAATFNEELHQSYFGWQLAVPEGEAVLTAIVLSVIIVLTIIGNILVILSVFTYKPLRIAQNFFIVSLAVADLTVALLVLPFNVAYSILGHWEFGIHLCKMWLTCDVMCCTSSILNLCAIALDRYWAITDPINYAQKRTVGRVLLLIMGVWILSLLISSPPLVGWNDWPEEFTSTTFCELTSNRGYVIYSSLGSFFIPLAIMTIVYIEIYIATRRRLRERAQASKINATTIRTDDEEAIMAANVLSANGNGREITFLYSSFLCCGKSVGRPTALMVQNDKDSVSSETHANEVTSHHLEHRVVVVAQRKKSRRANIKDSIKRGKARSEWKAFSAGTLTTEQHYEYWNEKTCAVGEHRLLAANTNDKDSDNYEVPTEIGIVTKPHMETCPRAEVLATDNNEVEHVSLKITPPQSSPGATSSQAFPLHKKPSGMYQFIEEKQKISLSKERRAARTLGIIMGVFVICWLPFFLMYVILPFCDSCCPSSKFKNFITWLGYINSGLNPVIYTIFNLDFRRAFKRLLGIK